MREDVKEGYEKGDYESDYRQGREVRGKEKELFRKLFDEIPENSRVLDLGCGTGLPFDRFLVEQGFDVLGVDIAEKHVEMAEENVPEGKFVAGDFFEQDFRSGSFDAVVSMYAIFHIPRDEHLELFQKMHDWLAKDGAILVTLGAEEMDGFRDEIGGEELVWSSYSPEKSLELLEKAGFEIIETYTENYRDESHFWILATPADR